MTFIIILMKYTNYIDIFSLDLEVELLKYIIINNYVIDLINNK